MSAVVELIDLFLMLIVSFGALCAVFVLLAILYLVMIFTDQDRE